MHIAYYAPSWPPLHSANGIVTYVSQMKNALEKKGHRVTVITRNAIYSATRGKIELEIPRSSFARRLFSRLSLFSNWHVAEGKRLASAFNKYCSDVDLLEMEESFGLVAAFQSILSIPVVIRLHGPNIFCQIESLSGKALIESNVRTRNEGVAIKSARYVSAPSAQVLRDVLDFYGASPVIGKVVYNPAPEFNEYLWTFEKSNHFEILHVGRFDRLKGADLMVQAFCLVAGKYGDARLIMVGPDRGLQVETGDVLSFIDYRDHYVPEGVRDRITFLGSQDNVEVNRLRLSTHIAVMPSRFETMSYCALETLSLGIPLICTDGIVDNALVIDNETGWHFKNGSAESLANSINRAFECGDNIQLIANAGRQRCLTHFYPDVIGPKMISFYEDVLKDFYSE